jgi:hypothetical protein
MAGKLYITLTLLIFLIAIPIALSDVSCNYVDISKNSLSNYYSDSSTPYYASVKSSAYIGFKKDNNDKRIYHAYYVYKLNTPTITNYANKLGAVYVCENESVFRSREAQIQGFKKITTVAIGDIDKVSSSTVSKTPKKIVNSPDNFYYRPDKRTTLERPYYYYLLEKEKVINNEVDSYE